MGGGGGLDPTLPKFLCKLYDYCCFQPPSSQSSWLAAKCNQTIEI